MIIIYDSSKTIYRSIEHMRLTNLRLLHDGVISSTYILTLSVSVTLIHLKHDIDIWKLQQLSLFSEL